MNRTIDVDSLFIIKSVLNSICQKHGVTYDELMSLSRKDGLTKARREAIVTMRDELKMSYPFIALMIKRDHSTVLRIYEREKGHDNRVVHP
jgi:chromosomal replication initiation ATPase DnaA